MEPFLAVRDANPVHLLAGAIVASPSRDGPWDCVSARSDDGGATWETWAFRLGPCVDPWILFTADGGALFSGIEVRDDTTGQGRLRLALYRSPDGGRTWPPFPDTLGRGYDHELMAVDRSGGPRDGWVYLTAQRTRERGGGATQEIAVFRSTDHGRRFTEVASVRPSGLPLRPTGIAVLYDGTVVITYLDRSPRTGAPHDATRGRRAWALRSGDGAATFSEPHFVTAACGDTAGFAGYPSVVVARSGPLRDRLFHACVQATSDGLALVQSADGGRTWSDPVRVGPVRPRGARTPMLAVNAAGIVGLAWYDGWDGVAGWCQHLYFTASADTGRRFAVPVRVSSEASCPATEGNGRAAVSWPMGGDYGTLVAGSDGLFHVMWADSRSGVFQLRTAALRLVRHGG